ncbi:MAG: hypothetical protein N3C57_04175 [Aquificaceae bacterium]|nr:hypothetical protein [Aquificaceae bacterium]
MKILSGKKLKLIVNGTILPLADTNRARTQKIKGFSGKVFWTKKKRNIYSVHYGKRMRFEELYYGVVYDLWFTYGSVHEAKAYKIRKVKSAWFRRLVEDAEVYGDRGYKGVEVVNVYKSKEDKSIRQVVEGVISCVKSFNAVSRWRKDITLLAYLYGYSIAYSFFRGKLRHG